MLIKNAILAISVASLLAASLITPAMAQNDYAYCQRRAESISGYYGPAPKEYRRGEVMKGAATGAALGAIFGKKGKKGKAVKDAAALGALFGAIKKSKRKKKERRARESYQYELSRCMAGN